MTEIARSEETIDVRGMRIRQCMFGVPFARSDAAGCAVVACNRFDEERVVRRDVMSADAEDVTAILAGEVGRFEGIVLRWQRPLVSLAYRFVRDEARAEELAQEAFLKCFRSLRQWRGEAQFSTWLFSVAISVYRSQLRRFEPVREALEELAAEDEGLVDLLVERQRAATVRRAVDALPPLYREPLIVFYFRERDLASTAHILGLREGTLKARLHRGRELLRKMLVKEGL
jgi:RNA polymerase sigma-70 factor (ECF subfamily)